MSATAAASSQGWHNKTNHRCRRHQKLISILLWKLLKQSKLHFWTFISGALIFQSTSSPSSGAMRSCWKGKPTYTSQKEWKGSERGHSIILTSYTVNFSLHQTGKCFFTAAGFIQHKYVSWWEQCCGKAFQYNMELCLVVCEAHISL